jgi:parallel beta-helix repeat protein
MIKNCTVDMLGNKLGQGIDISYNMDMGMSMVEGCRVTGGMEGITTHSSMTDIVRNSVSRTTMRGISVTEMSMGMVRDNEVQGSRGIGIWCNDRSMCSIEHNTVVDTAGVGVLASFMAEADLRGNELTSAPVPYSAIEDAEVRATH